VAESLEGLPEPKVPRRRGWPSAVWIVPVLAIAAGGILAVRTYLRKGPTIHITFETAEGLEAGKSEVRYRNVPVGRVIDVRITEDHLHIVATAELTRGAAALAVDDSRFWIERPRIGLGGVSGLGTLLSGAYIGVDLGSSTETRDSFDGLEIPPGITRDQQGRRFQLAAEDAGSLAVRSPIYLHRVSVGWISKLDLAPDGKHVAIEVFVQSPYDHDVTPHSVFWNASGLDVSIDSSGLRVDAQSLATVVAGGIAFEQRPPLVDEPPAAEGALFSLYQDRAHALAPPDGLRVTAKIRFHETVRGMGPGTEVNFEGVGLGYIDKVTPTYDPVTHELSYDVIAATFPERLGAAYTAMQDENRARTPAQTLQLLVGRGLRAQIRSANLLTGQAYLALSWFPHAKPVAIADDANVWTIPSERGGVDQLEQQVSEIVGKIDRIPFDTIGESVTGATRAARDLFGHLDRDVTPEAQKLFAQAQLAMTALHDGLTALRDNVAAPDSPIQQSTKSALEQVERAAFSLRTLSDYVSQHPESLLRGRASGEPKARP